MKQVVPDPTRLRSKPPGIKDPIITTLSQYYQKPLCLPPLRSDSGNTEADHLIVFMEPICSVNNIPARKKRQVTIRKYPDSQLLKLRNVLEKCDWSFIFEAETTDMKAELLQTFLLDQLNLFVPEQRVTFSCDDIEYFTPELKLLDRKGKRIYTKHGRSYKYRRLNKVFKEKLSRAKESHYKKMIQDLKVSRPGQWYSKLKRMTTHNQQNSEQIIVDEICDMSEKEHADYLADYFPSVSKLYEPINKEDISLPTIPQDSIPIFTPQFVLPYLQKI